MTLTLLAILKIVLQLAALGGLFYLVIYLLKKWSASKANKSE